MYLVTSIIARDFYKVPITIAFLAASMYAVVMSGGIPLRKRIDIFSRGAATGQMMLMIWIFILAGAFANSAKVMGAIDATANLALMLFPANMLLAGLFLAACFISISVGTSVGTIVALTPIAAGVAQQMGASIPLTTAVVVGGSLFGDNLSFISDTTVCATQSQGCKMSDKFKTNMRIAAPAAMLVLIYYAVMGTGVNSPGELPSANFLKVMPYVVVLITAMLGVNVLIVLTLGILLTGIVGLCYGDYTVTTWFKALADGTMGMGELIIITMLAGGVLEVIRANGGIRFLMDKILKHVHSERTAELSIGALVSVVDICTANNTVAIITVSGIARDISNRFHLDPRRVASILDTFSCIMQGIIPYGAQMLMGAALAGINPVQIIPHLYYPYILLLFSIAAIMIGRRKKKVTGK